MRTEETIEVIDHLIDDHISTRNTTHHVENELLNLMFVHLTNHITLDLNWDKIITYEEIEEFIAGSACA